MLLCYKSDRAITYVFCRDLHLIFMFSGFLQKRSVSRKVKFGEKVISNKIIVTLVKQGLPSSFISRPVT